MSLTAGNYAIDNATPPNVWRILQLNTDTVSCECNLANSGTDQFSTIPQPSLGTAQVATTTCLGTTTGAGNASVVVTGAALPGSPVTVLASSCAVGNGVAPATYGPILAAAINANAAIAAVYTASAAGAVITLTAKGSMANDATLNVAVSTGTATGITAVNSVATTAGVAGGLLPSGGPVTGTSQAAQLTAAANPAAGTTLTTRLLLANLTAWVPPLWTNATLSGVPI